MGSVSTVRHSKLGIYRLPSFARMGTRSSPSLAEGMLLCALSFATNNLYVETSFLCRPYLSWRHEHLL